MTNDVNDAAAAWVQPLQQSTSSVASQMTADDASLPLLCVDAAASVGWLSAELNHHHPTKRKYFGEAPTKQKYLGNISEMSASERLVCEADLHTVDLASVGLLSAEVTCRHPTKRKCLQYSPTKQKCLRNVSETSRREPADSESVAAVEARHAEYLERRRKNNVASKRSRETRKLQLVAMEAEAEHLELTNARLRQRVSELEELTHSMKAALVDALRHDSP